MIQIQKWKINKKNVTNILITEEKYHASVQVAIPEKGYNLWADVLIHSLWVDKDYRGKGYAGFLFYWAEYLVRDAGAKTVCLEWDPDVSDTWVREWFGRCGYEYKGEHDGKTVLVKELAGKTKRL